MFHGRQEDSLIWCKVEHGAIDGSIGVVEHFGRVARTLNGLQLATMDQT